MDTPNPLPAGTVLGVVTSDGVPDSAELIAGGPLVPLPVDAVVPYPAVDGYGAALHIGEPHPDDADTTGDPELIAARQPSGHGSVVDMTLRG